MKKRIKRGKNINKSKKTIIDIDKVIYRRFLVFLVVIIAFFVVVCFKLYQVMVYDNNKYSKKLL